jgi:hypothetical protein
MVRLAILKPLINYVFVAIRSMRLIKWPLIRSQPQPFQALKYRRDVFSRRTRSVSILNAQDELPVMMSRK